MINEGTSFGFTTKRARVTLDRSKRSEGRRDRVSIMDDIDEGKPIREERTTRASGTVEERQEEREKKEQRNEKFTTLLRKLLVYCTQPGRDHLGNYVPDA